MKKTLAFLTFSVLLITAMLFNVCAAFTNDDVGVYIRFDSQEKVDSHIYNSSKIDYIAFDDDMGALHFSVAKNDVALDYQLGLYLGEAVDLAQYPYMRVTYKFPLKTIKGDDNGTSQAFCVFPSTKSDTNSASGDYNEYANLIKSDDLNRLVLDFRGDCLKTDGTVKLDAFSALKYLRVDCPNDAKEDDYNDYYIYDIGFFKDSETAYSYNPVQTYGLLDLSDEKYATTDFWSGNTKTGVGVSYDSVNQATKFDAVNVVADGHKADHGDRIISKQIDLLEQFNASQYQWLSTKFKSENTPSSAYFLHCNTSDVSDTAILTASAVIDKIDDSGLDADGWQKSHKQLTLQNSNGSKRIIKYAMDPINNNYPNPTASRTIKYVAYYATEAEAKLETQSAPKGITVSAPTEKNGKGKICGLTTEMEYRLTGTGDYTAVVANGDIEVASGRSYDIRYKAKEGYNPGYALTVAVPRYWDFNITKLIYPDGEIAVDNAEKFVKTDKQHWTITVPKGIDVTKLVPVYSLTSDAPDTYTDYSGNAKAKRAEARLLVNGDYKERISLTSGGTPFGSTVKIGENQLHIYQPNAIYEVINVKFVEENENFELDSLSHYVLDHIVKSADSGITNVTGKAHSIMLGKQNTNFQTELQEYANSIASRYVGVTATVTVSDFKEPVAGTADNKEGTDGSCKLSIEVSKDDNISECSKENVPVPAAHYRMILNFASPILKSCMKLYTDLTSEFVEDNDSLGGKYLKITKPENTTTYAEFNFTLYFDGEYMPTIEQLADYPIVVYRDKYSTNGNYQIYYYTNGYRTENAHQSMGTGNFGTFTTRTLKTSFDGLWTGKDRTGQDTTWSNKVGRIRFDFMRNASGKTQKIACLDYIGFFATEADATAFINNPQVDNTQDGIDAKYSNQIAAMQAREDEVGTALTIPTDAVEYDVKGNITDDSIKAFVENQYYVDSDGNSILGTDSYIIISDKKSPVAATAAKAGTDGSFKFQVYFTDSTTNGYVATTQEITVTVAAKKLLSVETLGATIRKAPDTDALRFGVKVNFGEGKLITAVENSNTTLYTELNPTTELDNLEFGVLVLPDAALTTAKLAADKLTFAKLTATDSANIYKLGEKEVANVKCAYIYEVNADNFVYTAAITGIADPELKLVAVPYATYSVGALDLTETVYFKPITRSYKTVKTAVEAENAPAWDAD